MPDDTAALSERLARMTVRVTSPDRRVRVELRRRSAAVSFASTSAYAEYRDATVLAAQVSTALTSAYAAADQARRRIVEQHPRLRVSDEPHWDPRRRRLHEERDLLEGRGESPGGYVRVTTTGLRAWDVHVVAGTLQRLNAGRFCAEVNTAVAEAVRSHAEAVYRLKVKYLGRVGVRR